ncbi:ATP-dependent RNA helicase dbp9 [Fomitiporia mediterranea MF3/22]|uniref:ATP-dependent RNA helicase dbp9 n=1 Tax=Fomitiporia mediterranea (strain MF3/22) TaxID=694068 RepID=UPI00044090A6|nr:ATP-dependent RNA helicase dbp9 [Fomitiporia mediterranea MF3/22]EJD07329.1 ATP-dependent RNA helicase dbp9 [Fomitiporia mediterranea MF3/22]
MTDVSLLDSQATFASLTHVLDARLLRALADMGFARPTLVQAQAIPLALEGRDILARARTGSGKTASYCVPLAQKILRKKDAFSIEDPARQAVRALVLVPTKELADQVAKHLRQLLAYCEKEIVVVNLVSGTSTHLQRVLTSEKPDIVIGTPSRALSALQVKALSLSDLESLVIDEADLVLSYGHDEDIRTVINGGYLPKVYQSFLMSATMTKDVELLKGLVLRNPAILRLEEDEGDAARLSQYVVKCNEVDKFLLTYVILKLKLVKGKTIIFVNDVDRCYRVKLFLEQFSIKSCVLNSELPLNSRVHIVQEFNKGVYDYIIATDEGSGSIEPDSDDETDEEVQVDGEQLTSTQRDVEPIEPGDPGPSSTKTMKRKRSPSPRPTPEGTTTKKNKSRTQNDKEYGVVRGVDFIDVACVLNFDLPTSARAYTHRVGRTARAGRTGMALSFVVPAAEWGKNKVVGCLPSARRDEVRFSRIERQQATRGSKINEYKFDMKQVEAFRYRMQDALRSVTRTAIREARVKELKSEILNSEKLKAHFEENPLDLEYLRHDKPLHPTRVQPHMKHVPKYLMPRMGTAASAGELTAGAGGGEKEASFVPFRKYTVRGRGRGRGSHTGPGKGRKKKSDPLKKFGR